MLTALSELNCSDNLLTSIQAVYSGGNISVAANGRGYVELRLYHPFHGDAPQVTAVAEAGVPFIRWTESDTEVSAAEIYELEAGQDYLLAAHFLALTSSVPDGKLFTNGRITLTPNIDGGTWDWDEEYFSATFNSPATFTALKAGTSTITYTVEGASVTYDVTIEASTLPSTGQSFAWVWALGGAALLMLTAAVGCKKAKRRA